MGSSISEVIHYIEENMTEELTVAQIVKHTLISPFYFQKGFSMLCGFTVGDYIRQRRQALAGSELICTHQHLIYFERWASHGLQNCEKRCIYSDCDSKKKSYDNAQVEVPKFWAEHY